jgi:hypothetical protein
MTFGVIKKTTFIISFFLMSVCSVVRAQETSSLYFFSDVPQSSLDNPAIQNNSGKLVIGIPVLSGISANWNANFPFNALFSEGFSYSISRFYDALNDQGTARGSAAIILFFTSLQYNDYTFSLSVSEKAFSTGEFDKEIVRFIRDGTMDFYGTNENLGAATFTLRHYREIAPGISKRISNRLDIGIRPKILFGKINLETRDLNFSTETVEEKNRLLLKPEGSVTFSGPFLHQQDTVRHFSHFPSHVSPGDYFFQLRNLGVALDLGINFRSGKFTEWSLSLIDAGFIGFRHNAYDVDFGRPVMYSEQTPYQSHSPDQSYYREPKEALLTFGDSVSYILDVEDSRQRTYSMLPLKINARFKHMINENITAGAGNQFIWYMNQPQNRFTPYAETLVFPGFKVYGSLTLLNASALMPGLGFSYTGKWMQFYLAGNNIPGIVQPASAKHLNLSLGLNFLFDTQ